MADEKKRFPVSNRIPLHIACTLLMVILTVLLLWQSSTGSLQSTALSPDRVGFTGEYRIGDGSWHTIVPGQHISATKGDVTLRGSFHLISSDGSNLELVPPNVPVAIFLDHIHVTIREAGNPAYSLDHENPLPDFRVCGETWISCSFSGDGSQPVEILIHNPHRFGNETAVDALLTGLTVLDPMVFEQAVLASGRLQRNMGLMFLFLSCVLLGTALFSLLLHIQNNKIIHLMSLAILFAGAYLVYSAPGASFWQESVAFNTTITGLSMIFYMLLIAAIIALFLETTKHFGTLSVTILGALDTLFLFLALLTKIPLYDFSFVWGICQTCANLMLLGCLIREAEHPKPRRRWICFGMALLLIAFELDFAATAFGWWQGGLISCYIFLLLFIAAYFVVLRLIPVSINDAMQAKELQLQKSRLEAEKNAIEAQLKESRISIMLSQIQPHFIYNTLGTIERMCLKDPEKAFELVRNFSLYLRGNFSELDSVIPIRFTEEIKHVRYYTDIEKVRFPDMEILWQLEATDFVLPALTIQPLVENAIKHGLMRLQSGGTVRIRSYETETHYCVEVTDNGVGFDTSLPLEDKKHVGLRNIRGRLQAMINGTLQIESTPGVGTTATILIPKEEPL